MSTTTKAKAADPQVETEAAKPQPRSRVTRPEDVPGYEQQIGKKFVRRDRSTHDVFTPKSIFPEYLMQSDEMGEASAFCARYYVERSSNGNGEPEPPVPTLIFGREVRARKPAVEFMTDCAKFLELHEEAP